MIVDSLGYVGFSFTEEHVAAVTEHKAKRKKRKHSKKAKENQAIRMRGDMAHLFAVIDFPESALSPAEIDALDAYILAECSNFRAGWSMKEEAARRDLATYALAPVFQSFSGHIQPLLAPMREHSPSELGLDPNAGEW